MNYELEGIRNFIRDEVQKTIAIMHRPGRYMVIDSYDPSTGTAKGRYQPSNVPSGDIPVHSAFTGNGIGLAMPPSPNDVVWVSFQEGSLSSGVITHRTWTKDNKPPNAQSGEAWLQHAKGQAIQMLNDSTMALLGQSANNQPKTLYDANGFIITSHPNPDVAYSKYVKPNDNTPPKRVMLEDGTVTKLLRAQNG